MINDFFPKMSKKIFLVCVCVGFLCCFCFFFFEKEEEAWFFFFFSFSFFWWFSPGKEEGRGEEVKNKEGKKEEKERKKERKKERRKMDPKTSFDSWLKTESARDTPPSSPQQQLPQQQQPQQLQQHQPTTGSIADELDSAIDQHHKQPQQQQQQQQPKQPQQQQPKQPPPPTKLPDNRRRTVAILGKGISEGEREREKERERERDRGGLGDMGARSGSANSLLVGGGRGEKRVTSLKVGGRTSLGSSPLSSQEKRY